MRGVGGKTADGEGKRTGAAQVCAVPVRATPLEARFGAAGGDLGLAAYAAGGGTGSGRQWHGTGVTIRAEPRAA